MGVFDGLTLTTCWVATFASIGALMFGLDNGWWSSALGLVAFNQDYGTLCNAKTGVCVLTAAEQSAGTGIGNAGVMIGCAASSFVNNKYGRRFTIFLTAIIAIVGIIIEITASVGAHHSYGQLLAGKIINSISMGLACNVIPNYLAEISLPKMRASIINMYQFVQIIGVIISTIAIYQLNTRTTAIAYQVPIAIQLIAPALMLMGVYWLPESPRWLVWNGRHEEALVIIQKLYATPGNEYDSEAELKMLQEAFAAEHELGNGTWLDLLKGSDLRRTLIATGVQCLQQAQGSGYMTSYIVTFLIQIGITDVFKVVMALYCVYFVAIGFGFYVPDRFGRRSTLIVGAAICAVCLIAVAGINVGIPISTPATQKASIALVFIWYFFFGAVWSPLVWQVSSEVCPARNREKVLAVATFSGFGTGLIINFVSPFIQDAAYGNLGGKIGFLWGGFSLVAIVWTWMFVPECKGKTLEQLDYLFEHNVATRKFESYVFEDDMTVTPVLCEKANSKSASSEDIKA